MEQKLMFISDIHGSAFYLEQALQIFAKERPDKLIILGDLLYHGARNVLPKGYDTLKTAQLLNDMKDDIICIRGNCDSEVDQMVLQFPIMCPMLMLYLKGRSTDMISRCCLCLKKGMCSFTGIPM